MNSLESRSGQLSFRPFSEERHTAVVMREKECVGTIWSLVCLENKFFGYSFSIENLLLWGDFGSFFSRGIDENTYITYRSRCVTSHFGVMVSGTAFQQ
jgi:hypothetical protein